MRQIYLPLVAGLLLAAPAFAAITTEGVMSTFSAEGYTDIEIRSGVDTIKVEATRNGQRVEVIYDSATGDVVKSEAYSLGGASPEGHGSASGSDDGSAASGDDDSGHHDGTDDSHDDDSAGDDSHDGSGHDQGDDHGGDHGDDHGSDDSDDDSRSGSGESGGRS